METPLHPPARKEPLAPTKPVMSKSLFHTLYSYTKVLQKVFDDGSLWNQKWFFYCTFIFKCTPLYYVAKALETYTFLLLKFQLKCANFLLIPNNHGQKNGDLLYAEALHRLSQRSELEVDSQAQRLFRKLLYGLLHLHLER